MAFINVLFPQIKLIHGFSKSIINPISIVSNGNIEYRIKKNKFERYSWEIPSHNILEEDKLIINGFLSSKDLALNSFKFSDPDYPSLNNAIMKHDTGTNWLINIPFDENTPGNHPIFLSDTLTATINGNPATISSIQINSNGLPYVSVSGSVSTDIIRITGNIYFKVRLEDSYGWTVRALTNTNSISMVNMSSIKLIEVFE